MRELELEVSLDFDCCHCGHDMGVTLKCAGQGLLTGMEKVLDVKVPCLTCGNNNKVFFTPAGRLERVAADGDRRKLELAGPSYN